MKREYRYLVLKWKDIEATNFTARERKLFDTLILKVDLARLNRGKNDLLECVVVEDDWPEYEIVWGMIEKRVNESDHSR